MVADEGRLLDTPLASLRVYSEADLETALVDHLQEFLLEREGARRTGESTRAAASV